MKLHQWIAVAFALLVPLIAAPAAASAQDTIPPARPAVLTESELRTLVSLELGRRDLRLTDAARAQLVDSLGVAQSLPTTTERIEAETLIFSSVARIADRRDTMVVNPELLQDAFQMACRPPKVWPKCQE